MVAEFPRSQEVPEFRFEGVKKGGGELFHVAFVDGTYGVHAKYGTWGDLRSRELKTRLSLIGPLTEDTPTQVPVFDYDQVEVTLQGGRSAEEIQVVATELAQILHNHRKVI